MTLRCLTTTACTRASQRRDTASEQDMHAVLTRQAKWLSEDGQRQGDASSSAAGWGAHCVGQRFGMGSRVETSPTALTWGFLD